MLRVNRRWGRRAPRINLFSTAASWPENSSHVQLPAPNPKLHECVSSRTLIAPNVAMSVLLETSAGDIVIDLLVDYAPKLCEK